MSAHTPGPWCTDLSECEPGDSVAIMAHGAIIAEVLGADSFPCLDDNQLESFDKELQANARLMAAAPDLLKACKEAYTALPMAKHNNATNAILRAAIAKAEGR